MSLGGGGSRRRKAHRKSRAKSGEAGVWSLESEFNRDKVYFAEREVQKKYGKKCRRAT